MSILVLGSVPFAINAVYASAMRVKRRIKPVVGVYGEIAFITIAVSYLLMQKMGLVGVGIAWLLSNILVAGVISVNLIGKHRKRVEC